MKIERHETGPRMSKVVIHGDTVYLAGIAKCLPKWRFPSTVIEPVNGLWVGEVCKNSGRRLGDDMVAVVCHDSVFRFPATIRKEPW